MTTMPSPEHAWTRAATRQAIGLVLLALGLIAVPIVLWQVDRWLGITVLAAYTSITGYFLATTPAAEES